MLMKRLPYLFTLSDYILFLSLYWKENVNFGYLPDRREVAVFEEIYRQI
jgi:hypothetical protein